MALQAPRQIDIHTDYRHILTGLHARCVGKAPLAADMPLLGTMPNLYLGKAHSGTAAKQASADAILGVGRTGMFQKSVAQLVYTGWVIHIRTVT